MNVHFFDYDLVLVSCIDLSPSHLAASSSFVVLFLNLLFGREEFRAISSVKSISHHTWI